MGPVQYLRGGGAPGGGRYSKGAGLHLCPGLRGARKAGGGNPSAGVLSLSGRSGCNGLAPCQPCSQAWPGARIILLWTSAGSRLAPSPTHAPGSLSQSCQHRARAAGPNLPQPLAKELSGQRPEGQRPAQERPASHGSAHSRCPSAHPETQGPARSPGSTAAAQSSESRQPAPSPTTRAPLKPPPKFVAHRDAGGRGGEGRGTSVQPSVVLRLECQVKPCPLPAPQGPCIRHQPWQKPCASPGARSEKGSDTATGLGTGRGPAAPQEA